uniref:Uncharacterized protein n=1 Tax=Ditylenchus dipsaci TaxID=166011 RepID=A0A915CTT3_9BILA
MANAHGAGLMNTGKPSLLRRVSQSDPHLDIPHFLNAQEKKDKVYSKKVYYQSQCFNSFHHVLSGLIEGNSSLKVNKQGLGASTDTVDSRAAMPSSPDLTLKAPAGGLDRNRSAVQLSNFDPESTTDSNNPGNQPNSNTHWPLSHHFSHLNTGQHSSSHHNISTIPEDQGLMMSVRPTSGLAANALNSTGLMDTASSAMAGNSASSPPRSGVFGVFGRGFLAKPVIRSDEENYRYIMALDR